LSAVSGVIVPWHLIVHLDEESRLSGIPELTPTLVRWRVPEGAAPHLRVGLERLEAACRHRASWLLYTSSSRMGSWLIRVVIVRGAVVTRFGWPAGDGVPGPWSCMGEPGAGFPFGGDGVEPGLQIIADRGDGGPSVQERKHVLELAAVVAQLVGGERVQRVLGLLYCWGLV
jgi:hypothetical protein